MDAFTCRFAVTVERSRLAIETCSTRVANPLPMSLCRPLDHPSVPRRRDAAKASGRFGWRDRTCDRVDRLRQDDDGITAILSNPEWSENLRAVTGSERTGAAASFAGFWALVLKERPGKAKDAGWRRPRG